MYLSNEEEKALRGEYGEAEQIAYRILVAVGRATEAERLIPVSSAHISGVTYSTLGEVGVEFLEEFSKSAKVKVLTTVNPCGVDLEDYYHTAKFGITEEYFRNQCRVVEAYLRMGVSKSFTCIPYEGYIQVKEGQHVSWAESSAVIYGNSILGIRSNRESGFSALASAVTGKTPLSGLHLDENRVARLNVRVDTSLKSTLDYGLLGYYAGKVAKGVVNFTNVKRLSKPEAKALSAAIGTSGSIGMFKLNDRVKGLESIEFGQNERNMMMAELSDIDDGDAVVLGCPQLTLEELKQIYDLIGSRRFKGKTLLFISRHLYQEGLRKGWVQRIERAGGAFLCDSCGDLSLAVKGLGTDRIVTDTVKGAYYMKHTHGLKVALDSLETIMSRWLV